MQYVFTGYIIGFVVVVDHGIGEAGFAGVHQRNTESELDACYYYSFLIENRRTLYVTNLNNSTSIV